MVRIARALRPAPIALAAPLAALTSLIALSTPDANASARSPPNGLTTVSIVAYRPPQYARGGHATRWDRVTKTAVNADSSGAAT